MDRYACYCMTRNLYGMIVPSLNSLLRHSGVDRVFLLTEDDDIGLKIPDRVRIVNVSGQTYFPEDGPNYRNGWTWMVLMRLALHRVLPDVDRVLTLDLDTIVDQDIDGVWDLPIDDYYCAAAEEWHKSTPELTYVNGGVVLWNLKKLRDGKGDEMIADINTNKRWFPEQECVAHLCGGKIYPLPSEYNACPFTHPTMNPRIHHFAAHRGWFDSVQLVQRYKDDKITDSRIEGG